MENNRHGFPPAVDEAFEGLYRRHRLEVYRTLLRATGNREEAEDLAQKTFLNAYTALRRGNRPREPRAWLHAIARNTRRRRYRTAGGAEVELDPETPTVPEDEAVALGDLRAALRELTPNQRASFLLFEVGGLTYDEIADRLELTPSAVESLLVRARRTLRTTLGRAKRTLLGAPWWNVQGWLSRFGSADGSDFVVRAAAALGAAAVGTGLVASAIVAPSSANSHRNAAAVRTSHVRASVVAPAAPARARANVSKPSPVRQAAVPVTHHVAATAVEREPRLIARVAVPPTPAAPARHAVHAVATPAPAVHVSAPPRPAVAHEASPETEAAPPATAARAKPSTRRPPPRARIDHPLQPVATVAKKTVVDPAAVAVRHAPVPVALPVATPTVPALPQPVSTPDPAAGGLPDLPPAPAVPAPPAATVVPDLPAAPAVPAPPVTPAPPTLP